MADNNQSDAASFSLAEELVDSWSDHGSLSNLESGHIAKPSRILTYWNWLYEVLSGISGRVPEVYLKPVSQVKFLLVSHWNQRVQLISKADLQCKMLARCQLLR